MVSPDAYVRSSIELPLYTIALYKWCIEHFNFTCPRTRHAKVRRLDENILILTEPGGEKTLVNLDLSSLSWTTTFLTGEKRYTQSTYILTPSNETSTNLEIRLPASKNMRREFEGWRRIASRAAIEVTGQWFHFSTHKTFNAPLAEVFAWCTDYRETDAEFAHMIRQTHKQADASTQTMKILYRGAHQVRYVTSWYDSGRLIKQFTNVYLHPPNRWLAVGTGDYWDSQASYVLTEQDGSTTVDVRIHNRYADGSVRDEKEMSEKLGHHWDKIIEAFDRRREKS